LSERRNGLRLLVAAGGTGGHLYPALAVARVLKQRESESQVIFVGTRRGLERKIVPRAGFALEILKVEPLRGGSLLRKVKGFLRIGPAMIESSRLLKRVRPDVVMGVGGYASGPLLAVAAVSGVPTLILEPNAEPGLTNRWLSSLVDSAALAWEETGRYFGKKGFVSGNPVREEIARVGSRPANDEIQLLVFGGSQGSHALNRAMVDALAHLQPYRDRVQITHQTGEAELESVRVAYEKEDFPARVEAYLEAMGEEYEECDLVVSRAGATTCAELAAAGRGALLVPLPLAGGHQRANAEAMERAGAAKMIPQEELTGGRLAQVVIDLLQDPAGRQRMAEAAKAMARPGAAGAIVDRLLELGAREEAA
jgi:UDP-N-acetylglucosamine--N-acetylmuramyl-(pentapeptide) pyrophosphoryl-undecaprenol N-acetylglucosamine transferase